MWLQTLRWLRDTLRSFKQYETISISTVFLLCCSVAVLLFARYSGLTGTLAHVPPQQGLYNKDEASRQDIMIGRRPLLCLRFFTGSRLLFWLLPYLSQVQSCQAETILRALKFPKTITTTTTKHLLISLPSHPKGYLTLILMNWRSNLLPDHYISFSHNSSLVIKWNAIQIFLHSYALLLVDMIIPNAACKPSPRRIRPIEITTSPPRVAATHRVLHTALISRHTSQLLHLLVGFTINITYIMTHSVCSSLIPTVNPRCLGLVDSQISHQHSTTQE